MAPRKKTAKKVVRKAPAKRKTSRQYEGEIADLGERLKISQHRYTTLASAVESERALSKTVVTAYEEQKQVNAALSGRYNDLVEMHNNVLDENDKFRLGTIRLEGKIEGMMFAYQHALETVLDNLSISMLVKGELTATKPKD
ncbi:MAG TPA: hypothetical protein PK109_00040 [Candidatus Paceibacterota bacterium]|nr:hypothetical protein [Candidatus Paceibacterota bacterium]